MTKSDKISPKTGSTDDALLGPTERLVGHYQTHGYPKGAVAETLTHAKTRDDIHTYVRERVRQLMISDPFFLSDAGKTELRIVGTMANQLGIEPRVQLLELPLTQEEITFIDHFKKTPPPFDIHELENYLAKYSLPKKEGLAMEVRALVARMIMIRYLQDAKNLRKIFISPVLQKFFTYVEYANMIKNTDPKVRETLLYRPGAQDDFTKMDDDARGLLLERVTPERKYENEFFRTTCKPVPPKLSRATRAVLMRLALFFQNEKALIAFFEAYPDGDSISMMFSETGINRGQGILGLAYSFLQRLHPEEKIRIDWKLIFEKFTEPNPHFLPYFEHVPASLHDAVTWNVIMNAAIAQDTERAVKTAFAQAPKELISRTVYTDLLQICIAKQWSDDLYTSLYDAAIKIPID